MGPRLPTLHLPRVLPRMAKKGTARRTRYFLKLLGLRNERLPPIWWRERPEIVDGVFFSRKPKSIRPGARLIYYAIEGDGRCIAEAEATGEAPQDSPSPGRWPPEPRKKFGWQMGVKLLAKCAANSRAPRFRDYHPRQVAKGPYQNLSEEEGLLLADAIRKAGEAS